MTKPTVVVLTGAGVSAESGLRTFRDADGLWEGHNVQEVATPEAWHRNRELVLKFYNDRRRQLKTAHPNAAHLALAELEKDYEVVIVTQNVDNLHERAGSSQIIHLHGELCKVRSTQRAELVYDWTEDLHPGDECELGSQLRPHIVWFGEAVPEIERAAITVSGADYVLIVGTSMQVYPAAGLVQFAPADCPLYYIDPKPAINFELQLRANLTVIAEPATVGVPQAIELLRQSAQ